MDPKELDIAASVSRYGWTAVGVDEFEPNYVYSVGLTYSAEHPEIVIVGLTGEGYPLLQLMVKMIAEGESFAAPGIYRNILGEVPFAVRPVHPSHVESALAYAQAHCAWRGDANRLAAIQVFWPDDAGRYPFDLDCDPAVCERQPRLDLALVDLIGR